MEMFWLRSKVQIWRGKETGLRSESVHKASDCVCVRVCACMFEEAQCGITCSRGRCWCVLIDRLVSTEPVDKEKEIDRGSTWKHVSE